ncbi:MAG: hypothetical protein ACQEV0_01640 [Bacillota bacterium]
MSKFSSFFSIFVISIVLSGCSDGSSYNSLAEAKQALYEDELISEENVIGEHQFNNEYFVIFERIVNNERSYGVANFQEKETGDVEWHDTSAKVKLSSKYPERPVGIDFSTNEENKVIFKIGKFDESSFENMKAEEKKGIVEVDKDREVYYMLDAEM